MSLTSTKSAYTEGETISVTASMAGGGTAGSFSTLYLFISGISPNDTSVSLSGSSGNYSLSKTVAFGSNGVGTATFSIPILNDGVTEGSEVWNFGLRDGSTLDISVFDAALTVDTTAPTVTSFSPLDASTAVGLNSNITLTFSEAIQKGTGNIEIRSGSATGTLVESFAASSSNRVTVSGSTLTIDPTNDLANGTQYFVTFASGSVRDLVGNNYVGTSTYDFTTVAPSDITAPVVSTFNPSDGASGIAVGSNITLTFSEAIQKGVGNIEIRSGSATGTLVESFAAASSNRLTFSGSTLTIDPTNDLANGTQYFITFASGSVRDLAGNNYAGTSAYDLTTSLQQNSPPSFSIGNGKIISLNTNVGINDIQFLGLATQQNGKILLASASSLLQFNVEGSLDLDFGSGGQVNLRTLKANWPHDLFVQPDMKIVVVGGTSAQKGGEFSAERYNLNGSLDTTFHNDGVANTPIGTRFDIAFASVIQTDGKIVLAGSSSSTSYGDFGVVRYNTDGSLDTTFDSDGKVVTSIRSNTDEAHDVALQSDGKIVVAGYSFDPTGKSLSDFTIARYNSNGTLDTTFDGDGIVITALSSDRDEGKSVFVQADGKILVAGFAVISGKLSGAFVRYNINGTLDSNFGSNGKVFTDVPYAAIAVQPDGKIILAGTTSQEGTNDFVVERYSTDGTLDTTFSGDGISRTAFLKDDRAYAVAIQPDGKIIIAGVTSGQDSTSKFALVRYLGDGSLDTTFGYEAINNNPPNALPIYIEDSFSTLLDSNVTIYDQNLAIHNYYGSNITLQRDGAPNNDDQFIGSGALSQLNQGDTFSISGKVIGTVTKNISGILTLTFDSNATQELVNSTLQSIAYRNVSDAPPANVTLQWAFSDGNTGAQGIGGALTATGSSTVYISPTNDAPVLSTGEPSLANVSVRQTNPTGQSVASFLGNSLSDPDGISPQGIAIHAVMGSAGRWQFRLDGENSWVDLASSSTADALLLKSTDFVRFIPDGTATTQASLSYYGWDQSSGISGSRIDASDRVGTSAFSFSSNTATLSVIDTVVSSASYSLKADEYDLALSGTLAINGIGNALDNNVIGNSGKNALLGLGGDDSLSGGEGRDYLSGGEGNDSLDGGVGVDLLMGGSGDDIYVIDSFRDVIIERSGWDTIKTQNLNEINLQRYRGIEAAEYTGVGAATLIGSHSNNSLIGGTGSDTLTGKFGNDTLSGAGGSDKFVFNSKLDAQFNFDQITDFTSGLDKLVLDKTIFTRINSAVLDGNLITGTNAQDSDDYLIYDSNTQTLFYDADGNALGAKVAFAQLIGVNSLSSSDFSLI